MTFLNSNETKHQQNFHFLDAYHVKVALTEGFFKTRLMLLCKRFEIALLVNAKVLYS